MLARGTAHRSMRGLCFGLEATVLLVNNWLGCNWLGWGRCRRRRRRQAFGEDSGEVALQRRPLPRQLHGLGQVD